MQLQGQKLHDHWHWPKVLKILKDGSVKKTVVDKDEGPRAGVTAESLGKLKPVPLAFDLETGQVSSPTKLLCLLNTYNLIMAPKSQNGSQHEQRSVGVAKL